MNDLLPPNATPQERALSLATARVGGVPVPVGNTWNPQTCPIDILPWLAWSLSLDDWEVSWTEQQKRDAIAASVEVHRRKGTIGAVRRALQALGYEIQIIEGSEGPYTFAVYLDQSNGGVPEVAFQEAERLALSNKNARSHLTSVGMILRTDGAFEVVAAMADGETTDLFPFIVESLSSNGLLNILTASQDVVTTSVYPSGFNLEIDFVAPLYLPAPVVNEMTITLN